mgnify:CR=1 FL=1
MKEMRMKVVVGRGRGREQSFVFEILWNMGRIAKFGRKLVESRKSFYQLGGRYHE